MGSDAMESEFSDPLLQPIQIGKVELPNRIFSSSHAPGYNTDGTPSERYIAYHEEKARGGIGLTMIGGSSNVSIDSASLWGQLNFGQDQIIDPLAEMVQRIHQHGTAIMCQLTHMGRRNVSNDGDWLPTIAPTSIREPMHRGWPKEMDKHDIKRVIGDFARAAKRAETAGLDGIELCATSHLIDQFWTPLVNQRTDEYGGSIDNRLRFTFEVLEAIRETVGNEFLLGIRMIANEDQIGGLTIEESKEIAQKIAESGFLDFLNIASSSLATEEGLSKAIPPSGTPLIPYVPLASSIKETVDLPILHATRVTDISSARYAIENNLVDLIGMTRAHMADPHIVKKIREKNENRIRACVGASLCINRLHQGLDAACIQNPATGRETFVPQLISKTEKSSQKVFVVGAGPGGLEAARVCAERGHEVVLFEAQNQVGGQVVLAARASERQSELLGITQWLASEIQHLNVDLRLNTIAEVEHILSERPDVVVIATGGWPEKPLLESGQEHVVTSADVLSGQVKSGENVLIFDDHGSERALSVAEYLHSHGTKNIEIVTPDRLIGHDLSATTGPAYLKMLYQLDAKLTPDYRLIEVTRDGEKFQATLRNEHTRTEVTRTTDLVVVEHGSTPNDELFKSLCEHSQNDGVTDLEALRQGLEQPEPKGGFNLFRIGDSVASRDIAAAIYEARRLCQSL